MYFLLLLALFLPEPTFSDDQWFDRHCEGWFWYEHLDLAKPTHETKSSSVKQPAKPLSTAWIRGNIGHYLDRAIDEPTKENVSAYLYLDRLVKEKSERFAKVGKQVIESDPMLDENVRRPISPAAAKIRDNVAHQAKEAVLRKIAKKAGLVFYYQGNCKLCLLQAQTVELFREQYDFKLIPISTDGIVIPSLPDSRIETTPHPKLNIQAYPALFLMQPPDNIVLLRQGSSSFTTVSERMVDVAFEQGWIDQHEYQNTRINQEIRAPYFFDSFPVKPPQVLNVQHKQ